MAQLEVTGYSSDGLSHNAARRVLVCEASDIQFKGFEPLYDDAADVGLALVNPRTGNVTRWYLSETVTIPDDGVCAWTLKPTPETLRKQPELQDYQFRILND